MKYIAYGSNMERKQMELRCPGAKMIGIGYISGYRLEFYRNATVEKSGNTKDRVPVAVWDIDQQDELNLDCYEGFPDYYFKDYIPVCMEDGSIVTGMIYLMKEIRYLPPNRHYYDGIANTYRDLGLASQIDTVLKPALERSIVRKRKNE